MGVFIRNGIVYGGGGGSGDYLTVTQAQYDALPQSEKEDLSKFYFITDGQGGGGEGSVLFPRLIITSDEENAITITTPSGSTITPTSTVSGVWECDVNDYGEYTVTASFEEYEAEQVVNVDAVKVYLINIPIVTIPDGSTVLPTDDVTTWLLCADIKDKSYTTLSQVLADSETYNALLGDSNACAYMKRSTTFAGKGPGLVPTMTSNTTPSGECFASSIYDSSYQPYKAFDGNVNDGWNAQNTPSFPEHIGYTFTSAKKISGVSLDTGGARKVYTFKVQGTDTPNDSNSWVDVSDVITTPDSGYNKTYFFDNSDSYLSYRMLIITGITSAGALNIGEIQFYANPEGITESQYAMSILGRYDVACDALLSDATWASAIAGSTYWDSVLNVSVPTMTSNTAPSGECIGSSAYSGYDYFKAFDGNDDTAWNNNEQTNTAWVGYDFGESTRVSKVIVKVNPTGAASTNIKTLTNVTLRGSDDKTSWEDVTILANSIGDTNEHSYAFAVNESHRYYSVQATGGNDNVVRFVTLKFYGRTSSGEKIHGATNESAYILESGSPVTITDPSTLDAGTYTVYSRVAKDPANLSNDYSKTIRICPNTKEIVLMPERAVYWWGYESADLQDCSTANGWSFAAGYPFQAPTHNTGNVQVYSTASNNICGIGTKNAITDNAVFNVIYSGVERSSSNYTSWGGFSNNKNCESFNGNYSDNSLNTLTHKTAQKTNTSLSNNVFIGNSAMGKCTLYAMYLSNE